MPGETLTERRQQVLRIVVQEYVQNAQPVSSSSIAKNHKDLGVSAATIRNDMAALEREGLLTHPHTSAGRIPTDAGYRYFVHHLLADSPLPSSERRLIRIRFGEARRELDQWLRLSTSVLAQVSQSAALATAPRATESRYKHMELVAIQGAKVLMVLVLQAGTVKQQLLDVEKPITQDELSRVSNELNSVLGGATANSLPKSLPLLSPFAQQMAVLVCEVMERIDGRTHRQVYRDGLVQILEEPEFAAGSGMRKLVQVFEERALLEQVVDQVGDAAEDQNDIHVLISGDGRYAELQDISLVLSRYGMIDQATGILGVVGPLRMSYGRTISAVRFVAALMSEMVEEIYSP